MAAVVLVGAVTAGPPPAAVAGELAATAHGSIPARIAGPGLGDPYFPLDGNAGLDVTSYDVRDRYDLDTRRLVGTTRLRVRATEDLAGFHLDLLLPVTGVLLGGRPARWSKPSRHEVRIVAPRVLRAGARFTVVVSYAGRPSTVRWNGERGPVSAPHEVVTIGQPHMAPWWFAANDHPSDKASMDVRITTARGLDVVSVGRRVGRVVRGDLATTRWRAREPMAPYLAFFAAGRFDVATGRRHGLDFTAAVSQAIPGAQRRASMRLLRESPAVVTWLAQRLGPYPFGSTGGVVTSLNPGFALETQTRPVYPVVDPAAGRLLLVHELAHQWFGNSVSLERWSDIWLNEGLATWAEVLWTAGHGGPDGRDRLHSWYDERALDPDFWTFPLADPGRARLLDRAVYLRGAMTVLALGERIGRPALERLLRTWLARHRGASASTSDFEQLAAEVSGVDLTSFFDAWLHTAGVPDRTADNGL